MWLAEPIHSVHGQVFNKRRDKWQRKKRQQYRGSPESSPKLYCDRNSRCTDHQRSSGGVNDQHQRGISGASMAASSFLF